MQIRKEVQIQIIQPKITPLSWSVNFEIKESQGQLTNKHLPKCLVPSGPN